MSSAHTIAAVSSGWAQSRRALIRLSGAQTPAVLAALLRPTPPRPWTIAKSAFRLTDRLALACLAVRYDPPRSFTGEHSAELIVPGNPLILERILARLVASQAGSVREAQPGEFSARAYLNGKMTLDQAEGVAATIAAQTDRDLAGARALLEGQTGRGFRVWADDLATLLALVEAGIDFTDREDVVPIPPADLRHRLEAMRSAIDAHLGHESGGEQRSLVPRVVLVGPPNAGKSTLFNALLGRRRAVESAIAGTTRDALVEPLVLDAHSGRVLLIDLPGLDRAPTTTIERDAQQRAADEIAAADIILLCDPPLPERARFDATALPIRPIIRVRTKADLPLSPSHADDAAIGVCALDGWNLSVLRRAMADAMWSGTPAESADRPFLLPRHRRALAEVSTRLAAAALQIDPAHRSLTHPETLAGELRAGLNTLAELTGQVSPDDILGRIFSTFCVGK